MPTRYAQQQQGVMDGSAVPPNLADGREVHGNQSVLIASKLAADAWNSGDVIYLGIWPAGTKITNIRLLTGTSWGTATLDIGVGGDPRAGGTVVTADNLVDGATLTTTDRPTSVGPKASIADDAPSSAPQHLWATIGVANVAAAVLSTITVEFAGIS